MGSTESHRSHTAEHLCWYRFRSRRRALPPRTTRPRTRSRQGALCAAVFASSLPPTPRVATCFDGRPQTVDEGQIVNGSLRSVPDRLDQRRRLVHQSPEPVADGGCHLAWRAVT